MPLIDDSRTRDATIFDAFCNISTPGEHRRFRLAAEYVEVIEHQTTPNLNVQRYSQGCTRRNAARYVHGGDPQNDWSERLIRVSTSAG